MKLSTLLTSVISSLPALHPLREKVNTHCRRNNSILERVQLYPDAYLLVRECRSGEEWIHPLSEADILDLETQVDAWLERAYGGELKRCSGFARWDCDWYAQIKIDGSAPYSPACWESGGFYIERPYSL